MANALPLQILGGVLWTAGNPGYSNFTLDATTDKAEFILQMPAADTITKVAFRYGARTGTPPTYKVTLMGVDGSGYSDGTDLGGGSPTSKTFTPPADATWDGTTREITLTNSVAVTRGQFIAVVIEYSSGTVDASNCSSFSTDFGEFTLFPYAIQNNAGVRTKRTGATPIAVVSASSVYGSPHFGVTNATVHDGTTPDEVGLLFNLPAGWGATYQVVGVNLPARFRVTGQTVRLRLYDTNGTTVLQQIDIDSDYTSNTGIQGGNREMFFDEATLSTLSFGSTYRITITVTAASDGVNVPYWVFPASSYLNAFPLGANAYWTQRTDAGAWTDTNTQLPQIGLILADITEPSGGGGPLVGGRLTN